MGNKNPSKQPQIFEHPRLGSVSLVNAPNKLLQHTFSVSSTSQGEAFKQ